MDHRPEQDEFDALGLAAVVSLVVVGVVAVVDVVVTGAIEPGVLALVAATLAPLVPALVARSRRR